MTKRFSRAAFFAAIVTVVLAPVAHAQMSPSNAAKTEPTYTLTYPGAISYKLNVRVEPAPNGGQTVFVQSPPRCTAPASTLPFLSFVTDARLTVDKDGTAQSSRFAFGPTPNDGILLEAVKQPGENAYAVGVPETHGSIPFAGRLLHPLALQLFAGRIYDWNKGGAQTFAYFYAPRESSVVRIVTLTLTAPNGTKTEPVTLVDETVPARKLHASLALPFMPAQSEQIKQSDLRIGPGGEVVQFDKGFFDIPFTVKSRAVWETPTRFVLPFVRPDLASSRFSLILRADKLGAVQKPTWNIGLDSGEARSPRTVGHIRCDTNLSLTDCEMPWRDRVCKAHVSGGQVQWKAEAGRKQTTATPNNRTWWFGLFIATSVWEGPGMPFADLAVNGEKQTGTYFPMTSGWAGGDSFTLTRLADTSATVDGTSVSVRHYRFVSKDASEIYTDGARLIALLSSEKWTLIRDGWEAWAKTLPPPAPPTPEEKPAGIKAP